MRDVILTLIVFGSIPFIFRQPFIGLLMWIWLGIMNPHRLTWGFAYSMPFAQIVAIALFVSLLVNARKLHKFHLDGVSISLILLSVWIGVSPWFSFHPESEMYYWQRAFKIQLMVLIAYFVVGDRDHFQKLIAVLALSVGYYGIKGGLFTIATAGSYRVWGPVGTFIEDNNTLALAVIMTIPLYWYLRTEVTNKWLKSACVAAMIVSAASALGSHSRGGFLALVAMAVFLWLKSDKKAWLGAAIVMAVPVVLIAMPEHWMERMSTISEYDQDASAMGRINAWWVAWNVAVDRFPIGAGFAMYEADVFARYAPEPDKVHAAHSIYFQILGEHGFFGLFLFLSAFTLAWFAGSDIIRIAKRDPSFGWAGNLASMAQVSLLGYAVGGAFLSLSYFDLPYYIAATLSILRARLRMPVQQGPGPRMAR